MLAALLSTAGGNWTLLQSVAWTGMLADNLRRGSFSEAVERTFDGRHPCKLCRQIDRARRSEKQAPQKAAHVRLEFAHWPVTLVFGSPRDYRKVTDPPLVPAARSESPPVPPPRLVS
ncbi:MAG: hypothetical protein U1F98_06750 [Verrucomicrobiota bacterium]